MKKEILISQEGNEKRVAVIESGRLEEFYIERADTEKLFGNIYKGRVKSVVPGIGAAFIDVGTSKDGFLYVGDSLASPFTEDTDEEDFREEGRGKLPRIEEVLKVGQEIVVQVVKEPIRNKGARLTTRFSLPARYLVLVAGGRKLGVSRRIEDREERSRIKSIFSEIKIPDDVGFIVRTAGQHKSKKEFLRDIHYLLHLWKNIRHRIESKRGPCLIHGELDLVQRVVRDSFTEDIERTIVDRKDLQRSVQRFFRIFVPGHPVKVELHHEKGPLFERYQIEKEIEKTFSKVVYLKCGGHIVIEQTEGLVAIDVNSGRFTGKKDLEETVYKVNLEAAEEVARQIRLRDIGGIIVIDFIDMEEAEHRRNVFKVFQEAVGRDRAKFNVLEISELGLVEMTRQRVRPSLESAVYDSCPYCRGKGSVKSVASMSIEALRELRKMLSHARNKVLRARLHPEVAVRLLGGDRDPLRHLERDTHNRVDVVEDPTLHREEMKLEFVNQ